MNARREFFRYVIPSMLAFALSGVYAIADGFFVGNALGDSALAAINIAFPLTAFLQAVGTGIGMGGAIQYAISKGEGNELRARRYFGTAFFALLLSGALLTAVFLLAAPSALHFLGASGEICLGKGIYFIYLLRRCVPDPWNGARAVYSEYGKRDLCHGCDDRRVPYEYPAGLSVRMGISVGNDGRRRRDSDRAGYDFFGLHGILPCEAAEAAVPIRTGRPIEIKDDPCGRAFPVWADLFTKPYADPREQKRGGGGGRPGSHLLCDSELYLLCCSSASSGRERRQPAAFEPVLWAGKAEKDESGLGNGLPVRAARCGVQHDGAVFRAGTDGGAVRRIRTGRTKCGADLTGFSGGLRVCRRIEDNDGLLLRNVQKRMGISADLWRTGMLVPAFTVLPGLLGIYGTWAAVPISQAAAMGLSIAFLVKQRRDERTDKKYLE